MIRLAPFSTKQIVVILDNLRMGGEESEDLLKISREEVPGEGEWGDGGQEDPSGVEVKIDAIQCLSQILHRRNNDFLNVSPQNRRRTREIYLPILTTGW